MEKVVLSNNPLSIIPDYRTKVLAQFGDRASEVKHILVSVFFLNVMCNVKEPVSLSNKVM